MGPPLPLIVAGTDDGTCMWNVELAIGVLGGELADGKLDTEAVGDDVAEDAGVPEYDGVGEIEIVTGTVSG